MRPPKDVLVSLMYTLMLVTVTIADFMPGLIMADTAHRLYYLWVIATAIQAFKLQEKFIILKPVYPNSFS